MVQHVTDGSRQGPLQQARRCELRHDWIGAAAAYAQLQAQHPADPRPLINQGHALWQADLPAAALRCYGRALQLEASHPLVLCGLGHCCLDLREFEAAEGHYAQVDGPQARWGRSQVLIGLERYGEAYLDAEDRRLLSDWTPFLPGPWWGGHLSLDALDPASDLVVWSEQGYGDTLQYLRWLPALADRRDCQAEALGCRSTPITVAVEANLVRLLSEGLAWLVTPPRVLAKAQVLQTADHGVPHGPLMSLPHQLGGAPLPVPSMGEGSNRFALHSPLWGDASGRGWAALLPATDSTEASSHSAAPRVGLVWASGRKIDDPFTHREYRKRSLPPAALLQLLEGLQLAGAQLISLQYGNDEQQAAALGFPLPLPRLGLGDFAATARVVAQLDLVISVDTAMAHLVGAMGAPGWVLLPWSADPRWLRDRSDSPWYPSLRLFRQPSTGAWREAIDDLLRAYHEQFGVDAG